MTSILCIPSGILAAEFMTVYSGSVRASVYALNDKTELEARVVAFTVEDLAPNRKCSTTSLDSCTFGGDGFFHSLGDHGFRIKGVKGSELSLNLSILNLEIGTGGSSSEDDADFIATVEFSNSAGLSYSFEKIKFDNYGFRNERVSVVMYKDENISNNRNSYDDVLFNQLVVVNGNYSIPIKIPEDDSIIDISFTGVFD